MPRNTRQATSSARSAESDRRLAVRLALTLLAEGDSDGPASTLPELVDVLGPEQAMLLVLAFGGTVVRIPRVERIAACLDEATAAMDLFHGNGTARELAKKHGVSEGRLMKICATLDRNRKEMKEVERKLARLDDAYFLKELFE